MWPRNLVFSGLCLLGLGAIAANLLSRDRVRTPESFRATFARQADIRDVVKNINDEFLAFWETENLSQAEPAPPLLIARRLSLALTGTVPSLEELRTLETVDQADQVDWWLAHLLEDRRYHDYVAERLARAFVGTQDGPFILYRRRRFVSWLSDQLAGNVAYDEVIRQLISEQGLWTSNPSVNFLTVTIDENEENQPDEINLASRTARAFLGMRIDCLQCHDDRLGNVNLGLAAAPRQGLQSDFHRLAAFFGEAELGITGVKDNAELTYKFKYPEVEEAVVDAAVPFFPDLLTTDLPLRQQLAMWVTHDRNQAFARATVNRVWALLFGRPLVDPIDDIPLFGTDKPDDPFYAPAIDTLANDFVDHGCDLRRLIRVIVATRPFQMDSQSEFSIGPEHESAWAVFPLSRLRPEQVAGGLIQACSLKTIDAESHILVQLVRFFQQNEFVSRYGDTGDDEFGQYAGTVTQRLLMMNGDLVKERTGEGGFRASARIANLASDDETAVKTAYLAVLTRAPLDEELQQFSKRLDGVTGTAREERLEDLFWTLLNSTEFSWNH
ncbi:MAG: DUF1549 and DUF1553 domain-containing protein [Pirellulaceae bacterium]|nr:DUF1549 and DUF1553 domain-containing protein [Pirellulaceae bacterium]